MSRFDKIDKALRLLRRRDGRSQVDLAAAAGVTAAMLSNYEKGTKIPSLASLGKILDALGVSLQALEEALDAVNDRRSGSIAGRPLEPPAGPLSTPRLSTAGGTLADDLEVGLFEISRGLAKAERWHKR